MGAETIGKSHFDGKKTGQGKIDGLTLRIRSFVGLPFADFNDFQMRIEGLLAIA